MPHFSPLRPQAILAAACLTALVAAPAQAANHPEREWLVKESPHFSLHYYPGFEKTAVRLLKAAEEAYPKLAKDFGAKVETRIPIIINQDSFFNGSAEPLKDRILLDPGLANSSVIGTQRFVAHELAHIMTFAAIDQGNKLAQLNNLGGIPSWFLEGVAQYATEYWYPSNDRMLRLHTLEGTLLSDTERQNFRLMGVDGGAAGYNEGYSLCRYMFDTYGRDKLPVLMKNLKNGKRTFHQAIEATFGANFAAVEAGWKQSLRDGYHKQIEGLQAQVPGSVKLVATYQGEVNVQPRLSPDGKRLAYLTSRYQDSFLYLRGNVMGFLSLYLADPDGRNAQMVPVGKGMVSAYGWSPDSQKLVYSRVVADADGNPTFDLYVYDLKTRKNERLTTGESTNTMAWSPDGREVVYVSVVDGQDTVKAIDVETKKVRPLLVAQHEQQYKQPDWSPDGRRIAMVSHKPGHTGHLVLVDAHSGKVSNLTAEQNRVDDVYPTWTPDGKAVIFTSDRGGMTNLYRVQVADGRVVKLTNTYRGAEMPSLTPDGQSIYYTSYRAKGSEIYRLPLGKVTPMPPNAARPAKAKASKLNAALESTDAAAPAKGLAASLPVLTPGNRGPLDQPSAPTVPEAGYKIGDAKPYTPTLTNDLLVPQMTNDEKGQQIGVAGIYSDILDKHQLGFDVRYGLWSQRFSYNLQYINHMATSSWMVSLFDTPTIGLSPDIGRVGTTVYDSLYFQRQRGAALAVQTPLGAGRNLLSAANFSTLSTLTPPTVGDYGQLREGQLNTLTLGYTEQHVSPTIDMDINPSDGYRLGAQWTFSDRVLGSEYNFSQFLLQGERYFTINPELRHNLTWRWNLGLINGAAAQPFLLGGAANSNPVYQLRGYSVGAATGNRLASTGVEYTAPLMTHIDKMFGPLYLDRLYVAGFFDVGSAWDQGNRADPFASTGLELRLRTSVMGGQLMTFRFGLAKQLGNTDLPGFYISF